VEWKSAGLAASQSLSVLTGTCPETPRRTMGGRFRRMAGHNCAVRGRRAEGMFFITPQKQWERCV
jgi:hypothetical protein